MLLLGHSGRSIGIKFERHERARRQTGSVTVKGATMLDKKVVQFKARMRDITAAQECEAEEGRRDDNRAKTAARCAPFARRAIT